MNPRVDEIADGIYRISTCIPEAAPGGFTFNQYLVRAEEPLLFHTGPRQMFPLVAQAVASVLPIESLRWVTFGHVESDECGSMNQWLAAAPDSTVAHGATACEVSLNDLADRPPRVLADGDVLDLGGHRIRYLDTPHVPHGWEAGLLYEETTGTLLCGDLFGRTGDPPALTSDDIVGPAIDAERLFRASSLSPNTLDVMHRLADLDPQRLALMHGSTYEGDGAAALRELAAAYAEHFLPR